MPVICFLLFFYIVLFCFPVAEWFSSESKDSPPAADTQSLLQGVTGNINSTILLSPLFDLRDRHENHFASLKLLLVSLLVLLLVAGTSVVVWLAVRWRRRANQRRRVAEIAASNRGLDRIFYSS